MRTVSNRFKMNQPGQISLKDALKRRLGFGTCINYAVSLRSSIFRLQESAGQVKQCIPPTWKEEEEWV